MCKIDIKCTLDLTFLDGLALKFCDKKENLSLYHGRIEKVEPERSGLNFTKVKMQFFLRVQLNFFSTMNPLLIIYFCLSALLYSLISLYDGE